MVHKYFSSLFIGCLHGKENYVVVGVGVIVCWCIWHGIQTRIQITMCYLYPLVLVLFVKLAPA